MKPYRQCFCKIPGTKRQYPRGECPDFDKRGHAKWYARVEAPGDGGKRRQPRIGPFDTEKKCKEELQKHGSRIATIAYADNRRLTFRDFATRRYEWRRTESDAGDGLKRSTMDAEQEALTLYLLPALGHLRLADVRDGHFRDLAAAMRLLNREGEANPGELAELVRRLAAARATRKGRRLHSRPVSEARIKRVFAVASGILGDAVRDRILEHNPVDGALRAKGGKRRSGRVKPLLWTAERTERWQQTGTVPAPVMVWTSAQCGNFLDFTEAAGERLHGMFHLDAYWGLRRSELVGLDRADLSTATRRLHVRQGQVDDDLDETKSEAGDRTIVFDAATATVLIAERKRQAAEALLWGAEYQDSGRVFTREDGSALRPAYVSERFVAALSRHAAIRERLTRPGWTPARTARQYRVPVEAVEVAVEMPLPPVRFHDLRHGAATMLLAAGAPMKLVSDVLGHASAAFTSDVYAVVAEELAEAAAVSIAAFVPRRNKIDTDRANPVPTRAS